MPIIEDVLTSLRRIIRATDLHSRHLNKTSGLTGPQLLLLQAIADRGITSSSELAQAISLSAATVTTIIDRLENRGLVSRERSTADRRKVFIRLTEAGRQRLQAAPTPLQAHFIARFSALEPWEQSMILASLQRVACMMDADQLDAAPVLDIGTLDRPDERPEMPAAGS